MSHRLFRSSLVMLLAVASLTGSVDADSAISVTFSPKLRAEAATGRLIVYLAKAEPNGRRQRDPADGFNELDPQPIYGVDVHNVNANTPMVIGDSATAFPVKLSELPPGRYRAQAVLDLHYADSDWAREPGNLSSKVAPFEVVGGKPLEVKIELTDVVVEEESPKNEVVEYFEVRSKLLSEFRKQETKLRAGVVLPANYDPKRKYASVYEVPGFGGNHLDAIGVVRSSRRGDGMAELRSHAFWIVLDPESRNGHTLFADSANNGPCGRALIEELIPALETKYPLIAESSARLLRGHSSGGWSTIWLGVTYPQTFGGVWSSSPDPVDFRRFELVNIYEWKNMYVDPDGKETPSARFGGKETMTVRQENGMEQVLGPNNSQGQQWDSWLAVFGSRNADGSIKDLYNPVTGELDREEAKRYERYDIRHLLATQPDQYLPLFRDNIRILCGAQDTYYLEEAVKLLKEEVDKQMSAKKLTPGAAYIRVVPGFDHSSIFATKEMKAMPTEMVEHLKKAGHVKQ